MIYIIREGLYARNITDNVVVCFHDVTGIFPGCQLLIVELGNMFLIYFGKVNVNESMQPALATSQIVYGMVFLFSAYITATSSDMYSCLYSCAFIQHSGRKLSILQKSNLNEL